MVNHGWTQGVYQFTQSYDRQIILVNYNEINAEAFHSKDEQHSAITESSTSSLDEGPAFVNMDGTSKNLAQMISQQQEQINCQ